MRCIPTYSLGHGRVDTPALAADELIFPRIAQWRAQQASPTGDKSEAANNFLWKVLPRLAVCAIQDGICWLKEFPEHEVSRLLLHAMPAWYPQWATQARRECDNMESNRRVDGVHALNDATRAAFSALLHQMTEQRKEQQQHEEACKQREEERERREEERERRVEEREQAHVTALRQMQTAFEAMTQQRQHQLPIRGAAPVLAPPPAAASPATMPQQRARNVNDALRNIPRIPAMPTGLPDSIAALLVQHEQFDLASFNLAPRTHWSDAIKLSFNKRKYLYDKINEEAMRLQGLNKLERAANLLDERRGDLTVNQFYTTLRTNSPSKKTRKRKAAERYII